MHPGSTGGCPVTSFAILSDMGDPTAAISTSLDAANVANKPYLFEHTFTFSSALTGKYIRLKLEATNERGSEESYEYLSVLLARPPSKPEQQVQAVEVGKDFFVVEMPLLTDDGGSTILAYELSMDDGLQSDLAAVYEGLERAQRVDNSIHAGRQYRIKYRARN